MTSAMIPLPTPPAFNRDEIYIPNRLKPERTLCLSRPICALHLERDSETRRVRLGALRTMQSGTVIDVCGPGYNDRTVKVHSQQEYYFVFKDDLDSI